ncbi:MAG: DUF1501 domain-containing protein [Planctomycetes bacterium]|nr:DUF1501 domain-containing protein [Planctomycetota bacterium]
MTAQSLMQVRTNHDGVVSRRTFLRSLAAGAAGLGLMETLTAHAQELRRREMACILLFMGGGPSQFETFDPKPGHANGGATTAIDTAVNGIRIASPWTNVAREMNHIALVRSMSNREGEHQRATYLMHTGYLPVGGVRFPTLGSIVASEIAPRNFDLPSFVGIGGRGIFGGGSIGSGFLGTRYAPFAIQNPDQMPANVSLPTGTTQARFGRRLGLMQDLERDFAESGGQARVTDHRAYVNGAANLVRSPRLQAFDLSRETAATRDRYGRNAFGQGCLLARRLVETGVTFVEVGLNGWDTHQNNFDRSRQLSTQADAGFANLVRDLRERGRLDRTLIIWTGEFGRTPRINGNNGRDHYPRAFSIALAGGGIRGGRVIGSTSAGGNDITNRPVGVADLFCTVCHSLGIDPRKENQTPIGRPIRIVDGGNHVRELFGA